ncbi:MAG: hypothetical protein ACT4OZ_05475 [Gemmatimonadota bacterium]
MIPRDLSGVTFLATSAVILLWNVLLASQIARARRQSPDFISVTALAGLLIAPALAIVVAASSLDTGRAVHTISWIWPATLALFVWQSWLALRRRLAGSLIVVPIFSANLLVFLAAAVRYATQFIPELPSAVLGVDIAHATTLAGFLDRQAISSPIALQLPLLAPAYPARWRVSKTVRAIFASVAATSALFMLLHYPRAVRAAASFDRLTSQRFAESPRSDLSLGLRILPTLTGSPGQATLEADLALVDSLAAGIISVVIAPRGVGPTSLDSLRSALSGPRADSALLMVTLGYDPGDGSRFARSPVGYRDARLEMLDEIVRRLRPDVVLPALEPFGAGRDAIDAGIDWWTDYHRQAAALVHRLRPASRVGVAIASFTAADSVLYAWARGRSDIDLLGFVLAPSFGGGSALSARLRAAERWMRGSTRPHWVFAARSYPATFGEANQTRAIVGSYAWATRQPMVQSFVVEGAADHDELAGLRTASGRLRGVVAALGRARTSQLELSSR